MIKTYPEMNAKIKDLLRIGYDETDGESGIFLYAAQRIEELEAENGLLKEQLKLWSAKTLRYRVPCPICGGEVRNHGNTWSRIHKLGCEMVNYRVNEDKSCGDCKHNNLDCESPCIDHE